MRSKEEIEGRIKDYEMEIDELLIQQRESNFPQAVATLQTVINSKLHKITELNWMLE